MSRDLSVVFASPDLYVRTNRRDHATPWNPGYPPWPYPPQGNPYDNWALYMKPSNDSYFMSQETPVVVAPVIHGLDDTPMPIADNSFGPPPNGECYSGQPLEAIHDTYVNKPIPVRELKVGGYSCSSGLFAQESVETNDGSNGISINTLAIVLGMGAIIMYAIILARRKK